MLFLSYFDGVSQGTPTMGGAGGVLYISNAHWTKFSAGIDTFTNNRAELLVLKLLLQLALLKGV